MSASSRILVISKPKMPVSASQLSVGLLNSQPRECNQTSSRLERSSSLARSSPRRSMATSDSNRFPRSTLKISSTALPRMRSWATVRSRSLDGRTRKRSMLSTNSRSCAVSSTCRKLKPVRAPGSNVFIATAKRPDRNLSGAVLIEEGDPWTRFDAHRLHDQEV